MVMLRQMSKSRYNEIGHEYMPAPTAGAAPDIPPWVMTNAESPIVENLIVRNGKLQVRNSLVAFGDMTKLATDDIYANPYSPKEEKASTCAIIATRFSDGKTYPVLVQRRKVSGADKGLDPCHCHVTGGSVFTGTNPPVGPVAYAPSPTDGVMQAYPATIETMPGSRYTTLGQYTYALSYASAGAMTYEDGVSAYQTNVLLDRLEGSGDYLVATGGPRGGIDITTWLNRVWVLGGAHPANGSTATGVTSRLFYTNPVTSLTAQSDWTDPSSGLINQTDVSPDSTDPAVGLASTTIGLIIFRQRSIWVQRGTDPTSFILRRMTSSIGCVDARSIVEADNGVYFISDEGLMWTDGTTLKNMSGSLQLTLASYAHRWEELAYEGIAAHFTCALVRGNYLLVTFGHRTANADSFFDTTAEWSGLLDLTMGVWVTLSTAMEDGATSKPLGYAAQLGGGAVVIENRFMLKVSGSSYVTTTTPATYDVTLGSALVDIDMTNILHPTPPTDPPGANPRTVPFTAHWLTRAAGLSSASRDSSQLKRAYVDVSMTNTASAVDAGTMDIELLDAEDLTQVLGSASLAINDTRLAAKTGVAHIDFDTFGEVESGALVDIKITGPSLGANPASLPVMTAAEIHGAGLEYQATHDMRNPVN